MAEYVGKNDALNALLKQEKNNTQLTIEDYKNRLDEVRQDNKKRIAEIVDQWTERLEESEKWRRHLEG